MKTSTKSITKDAEIAKLQRKVDESEQREKVAIASWNEERQRAEREGQRVVKLQRRIKRLEQEIECAKAMILPEQISLYKAAMKWHKSWEAQDYTIFTADDKLARACKRAKGEK